jgi:glycosyltransferase involved in cell wall biosynthesis
VPANIKILYLRFMKRAILSVTNDLVGDARVHKVATSLQNKGIQVTLVGRKLKGSLPLSSRVYATKRFNLFFEKGVFFYAEYSIRLLLYLLRQPATILVSNDLDTLLPNFIASKLKGARLYYDTHEYFTGVPELKDKRIVRGIWERLEGFLFPRLRHVYTVNHSIAALYAAKYKVPVAVIRNLPKYAGEITRDLVENIILYQGAVNKDRGLEEMVEAMMYVENARLFIIGDGDILPALKAQTENLGISERIVFIGKVPFESLMEYTKKASIGLSIEKDTNVNYKFCLPNKLFDYLQAGVPVLASPLLEIQQIIDRYQVGTYIENHNPKRLATLINQLLEDKEKLNRWSANALKAAKELNWEREEGILFEVYSSSLA